MKNNSIDAKIDLAESFIQRIGDKWLEENKARPNTTPHKISFWISQYRSCSSPEALIYSQPFLHLTRLAKAISILEEAQVGPLDGLWRDLLSDNPSRVDSALHEIRVAATYQAAGLSVKIVPEGSERTPDFLVADQVEIECKHKGPASEADRARYDMYDLLMRKLRKVFVTNSRCGALAVSVRFHVKPSRLMIDEIVNSARSMIRGHTSILIEKRGLRFDYSIEGVASEDVEPTNKLSLPSRSFGKKPFDIEMNEGICARQSDGTIALDQLIFLSIACDIEHDYIKGVKSSLKSAAGQFSGDRPAIIVVDITETVGTVPESYFEQVEKLIEDFYRNNTTVSGIFLEVNRFEDVKDRLHLRRELLFFENENAKNPLPAKFAPARAS